MLLNSSFTGVRVSCEFEHAWSDMYYVCSGHHVTRPKVGGGCANAFSKVCKAKLRLLKEVSLCAI